MLGAGVGVGVGVAADGDSSTGSSVSSVSSPGMSVSSGSEGVGLCEVTELCDWISVESPEPTSTAVSPPITAIQPTPMRILTLSLLIEEVFSQPSPPPSPSSSVMASEVSAPGTGTSSGNIAASSPAIPARRRRPRSCQSGP